MARNWVDVDFGTGDRKLRRERFKGRIGECTESKASDKTTQLVNERLDGIERVREQFVERAMGECIKMRAGYEP